MFNRDEYFRSLKLTLEKGYATKQDLHDVLNFEPTRNRVAMDFREHIAVGLIDKLDAIDFVGGLE